MTMVMPSSIVMFQCLVHIQGPGDLIVAFFTLTERAKDVRVVVNSA